MKNTLAMLLQLWRANHDRRKSLRLTAWRSLSVTLSQYTAVALFAAAQRKALWTKSIRYTLKRYRICCLQG